MSGPCDFALLQRLARLKAQRALAELAAARRHEAEAARAVAAAEQAAEETYAAPTEGTDWQSQWRLRAALEEVRTIHARHREKRRTAADGVEAGARAALSRELGADALADRADAQRRREALRRQDRSTDVLASLRKPPMG